MSALEQYYAGTWGKVIAGGGTPGAPANDWNVSNWEATVTAKAAVTTTTKLHSLTTKRTWTRRLPTTTEASGTFEIFYDKSNPPYAIITPGAQVDAEFWLNDADKISGPVYIDDIAHKSGGMEGVQAATVKWTSNGPMSLPSDVGLT